jgi:4-hydroxy-tetrahydrodipicolinate reductase
MTKTRLVVYGAPGHMGQALLRAALEDPRVEVAAAVVRTDSVLVGEPLAASHGRVAPNLDYAASLDPDADADVLVDFTGPRAFDAALALAVARGLPFVSGTTGLSDTQFAALQHASTLIPVMWSANFSLGVALLKRLTRLAAETLGVAFDAEVVETHHKHKQDAPSGTALSLGWAIAEARGQTFSEVAQFSRVGQVGVRKDGEIGFSVVRAADIVGEHTVIFAAPGERVEITHRAGSRAVFAHGALRAAAWLVGKPPGRYELADVIPGCG